MDEEAADRPAVRVVCVDGYGRVLLLGWYDRVDDETVWEPPGGGVEPGETPMEAARRELHEETGLPGAAVSEVRVPVPREFRWLGTLFRKTEPFFLARFPDVPEVRPAAFTAVESDTFRGHRWVRPSEMGGLDGLEPPDLPRVLARLGVGG